MKKIVKDITPELRANDTIKRVAVYARVSCEKDTMVHSLKAQNARGCIFYAKNR